MKISIERKALANALNIVKGLATAKAAMPILANVAVGIYEKSVDFTCTDMDLHIRVKCEAAITGKTDKDGGFTVNASLFSNLVRSLSGDKPVELEVFKKKINVQCGDNRYSIGTLDIEEFPSTPRVSPVADFKIAQDILLTLLNCTAYCSQTANPSRLVLCGSLFRVNGSLTTVGCDGARLAVMSAELEEKCKPVDVVVPRNAVAELLKLLENNEEKKCAIAIGEKMVQFQLNDVTIISKIVEDKYPDYARIIPKLEGEGTPIGRADLLSALRRVQLFSDNCILEFRGQGLTIRSSDNKKDVIGDAQESLLVPKTDDLTLEFDAQFLVDALNAVDDDEVLFWGKDLAPGVLKVKSKSWTSVTAPINQKVKETAKAPETKPAEKAAAK